MERKSTMYNAQNGTDQPEWITKTKRIIESVYINEVHAINKIENISSSNIYSTMLLASPCINKIENISKSKTNGL